MPFLPPSGSHPDLDTYDLSSLKVVLTGGAPVPLIMVEQVKARVGADVCIVFGQTESSCCLTATLLDDPYELKAATVGKALPYIDIKIIDPVTGGVVPVGSAENSVLAACWSWPDTIRCQRRPQRRLIVTAGCIQATWPP